MQIESQQCEQKPDQHSLVGPFVLSEKNIPFVSIIVLNYNRKDLSLRCLQSLLALTQYPSYEILLIDNGSTDGSVQEIRKVFGNHKEIRILALGENFGYSEGNNIGYSNTHKNSKYVIVLNNDVSVDEKDWLKKLVEFMETHEDVGAASPLIWEPNDPQRAIIGFNMDVFGNMFKLTKVISQLHPDFQEEFNGCFSVHGAAFITRKELVEKVGLFNKRFFLYYEEPDFCWRLRLIGLKVVTVHACKVNHLSGATTTSLQTTSKLVFHYRKNRIYTLLVNYEFANLARYVPWVFIEYFFDITKLIAFSIYNKRKKITIRFQILGIMMSLSYLLFHFSDIWKDRRYVQEKIRVNHDSEIMDKNVIRRNIPFFVNRKRLKNVIGF